MTNERKELLQEQIADVFEIDAFCDVYPTLTTAEEVREELAKYDVDITVDEINELTAEGASAMASMSDSADLDLDDLEDVVGGAKKKGKKALKKFGKGVLVFAGGAAIGAGLGFLCGACPYLTPAAYKIAVGYSVVGAVWINS